MMNWLKDKTKMWYLAHPYSGERKENFDKVNKIALKLIKAGVLIYSPISMTHPIAEAGEGGHDFDWVEWDLHVLKKCFGLILCPGWTTSKGCEKEYAFFSDHGEGPMMLLESVYRELGII